MHEQWKALTVREVSLAIYVGATEGRRMHKNRSHHGLVINESPGVKEYCFSDGRVLRVEGASLFYLPRGTSYLVRDLQPGGSYAINFDAELSDEPFVLSTSAPEGLQRRFAAACREWRLQTPPCRAVAMGALYDAVVLLLRDRDGEYVAADTRRRIAPALRAIEHGLSDPDLSVTTLAALCGMSEVYLRRIFLRSLGVSPKEYIIQQRMTHARMLLREGSLSVSAIASLCGYGDPCHFSREFSRREGISPAHYAAQG